MRVASEAPGQPHVPAWTKGGSARDTPQSSKASIPLLGYEEERRWEEMGHGGGGDTEHRDSNPGRWPSLLRGEPSNSGPTLTRRAPKDSLLPARPPESQLERDPGEGLGGAGPDSPGRVAAERRTPARGAPLPPSGSEALSASRARGGARCSLTCASLASGSSWAPRSKRSPHHRLTWEKPA